MSIQKKRLLYSACRFILRWILLPAVGLLLCAFIGLFLLCEFKPTYVAKLVESQLREQTGLPFTVGGPVCPLLLPRPGVSIGDIRLAAADASLERAAPAEHPLLSLSSLKVTVDIPALLTEGSPIRVTLDEPIVTLAYAADGTPLWVPPVDPEAPETPTQPGKNALPSLDADLWRLTIPLRINKGGLRILDQAGQEVLELRGIQAKINPEATMYPIRLQAVLHLLKNELEMDFSLELGPTAPDDELNIARGRFTGDLRLTPPDSRKLEAKLSSSLFLQKDGGSALPDLHIAAEGDSLLLHLAVDPQGPSVAGKAMLNSLSLSRWFKFARNLPPGLQVALNKVSGPADLRVTADGVSVTNILFEAGDLPLTGLVEVADFHKPVVLVDLALGDVDLDEIFPFLALPDSLLPAPEEPTFDHPPLVPYPGPTAAEDLPEVGYDVRVAVQKPVVHSLPAGPVQVKVFPTKNDTTRVTFTCGELMKGTVEGRLDINHHTVRMDYEVENADLALLPENKDSSVQFHGRVTGTTRMDVPVKDGHWDDAWKFQANAKADGLKVLVAGSRPWNLPAKKAVASMDGVIHTNRSKGISLDGFWKVDAKNVSPSWNPKADDAFTLELKGCLAWPPFIPTVDHGRRVVRRGGLQSIEGDITSKGTLHVPLGSRQVPVSGTLTGDLDWNIDKDILRLDKAALDGLGSYFAADLLVDMSGKDTTVSADANFKLNPRIFLKEWKLLPGGGAQVPANVSGTSKITGKPGGVTFGDLDLQIDGAPAKGRVVLTLPPAGKSAAGQLWSIQLNADQLDLDNYFPPAKPEDAGKPRSTEPWDLSAMKNINLDAQINLKRTRLRKILMQDMLVSAALQRNRFTFAFSAGKLYDGSAVFLAQGTLDPDAGRITMNTVNLEVKSVSLGKALGDVMEDTSKSYGGTASFSAQASGSMGNEREIYAGMSGNWGMSIKDGLYPAFLGSDAGLRNTFSSASASGPLTKGVMSWEDFKLTGTLVDMNGDGMVDLGGRNMDFTVYVTLAKVPTVPVRFQGPFGSPSMHVRGAHMVVHTAKAAGTTVFDIFMGVLELPGRAARGVGDLFGGGGTPAPKPKP